MSVCVVLHCRISLRVSDGYVFVPTDKNSSRISRMDRPELLPSSKRHVWGRLVTLGNLGSKVCVCVFVCMCVRRCVFVCVCIRLCVCKSCT